MGRWHHPLRCVRSRAAAPRLSPVGTEHVQEAASPGIGQPWELAARPRAQRHTGQEGQARRWAGLGALVPLGKVSLAGLRVQPAGQRLSPLPAPLLLCAGHQRWRGRGARVPPFQTRAGAGLPRAARPWWPQASPIWLGGAQADPSPVPRAPGHPPAGRSEGETTGGLALAGCARWLVSLVLPGSGGVSPQPQSCPLQGHAPQAHTGRLPWLLRRVGGRCARSRCAGHSVWASDGHLRRVDA